MKLSPEVKQDLQALDCEYGGGIATAVTRTDVIDKPILILGLGGTGAEALIRVKRAISRQFNFGVSATGRVLDKPPQIEYMAIDSDANMLNLNYKGTTFASNEFLCLNTANLTSIYKNRDTVFKNSTGWMADNLRLHQVKHGAGGIRQAGRLLLTINCNSLISMLTDKINRLTQSRNADDLLYVFITTGCAGGTGSGIFIDVPYIVRKIAETRGFETENIGMIFLPDVTLADSTIDGSAALNIKANGFAALKELDYLMNIERNGETFEQTFADLEIKSSQPPYDLCHLVSAKDEQGKLAHQAKDYCMNVAAETIINFIASEEVIDGQSYTISSYLSNIENNRAAFIMTHQEKQPVNYIYNTVGASSAVLPIEQLLNYMTWQMFKKLGNLRSNSPTLDQSQITLESFRLDLPALERALTLDRPQVRDFKQYDHNVLIERPDILEDAVKNELQKLQTHYEQVADEIIDEFDRALQDKNNAIFQQFTGMEEGPFFAREVLSELSDTSVMRILDGLRKQDIPKKREHRDNLATLDISRKAAADKLGKSFFKKSKATSVVELNERYLRLVGRNLMYDAADYVYSAVQERLATFNNQIVDTFCELLTNLHDLFAKFDDISSIEKADNVFTWDFEDIQTFCTVFEENHAQDIDYKASLMRLMQDLLHNQGWLPGQNHTIVENMNAFVSQEFQTVADRSMDYFCGMMATAHETSLEEYMGEKIDTITGSAKVMFPINHIPSGLHISFPPYAYLSAPHNAPKVRNIIQKSGGTVRRVPNIKLSKIGNRLYMLNLKIAVPLYCYKELNDYEMVYESSLNKLAGVHLYESPERNWQNLPSPLYDKLWTKDHENVREGLKNNRLRKIFDRAVRLKIIRHNEQAHRLIGYFGSPVDLQKRFGQIQAEIEGKTLSATRARAIIQELDSFLADPAREEYSVPLFDTEYIHGTDTPDLDYAKGVFIYMPAFSEYIAREIQTRDFVTKLKESLNSIDMAEVKFSHFAQLLYMGEISKNRKNYLYTIDGEKKILYTTQTISEQFVEFDLFQAYLNMDADVAEHLQKRAQERENASTDKEFQGLVKTIDGLIKTYAAKLSDIENGFASERNGAIKKTFYQTMLDVLQREKKVLS